MHAFRNDTGQGTINFLRVEQETQLANDEGTTLFQQLTISICIMRV